MRLCTSSRTHRQIPSRSGAGQARPALCRRGLMPPNLRCHGGLQRLPSSPRPSTAAPKSVSPSLSRHFPSPSGTGASPKEDGRGGAVPPGKNNACKRRHCRPKMQMCSERMNRPPALLLLHPLLPQRLCLPGLSIKPRSPESLSVQKTCLCLKGSQFPPGENRPILRLLRRLLPTPE